MGIPTIEGLELERTMNLHATVLTIQELLRVSLNIDTLDDERREKLYGTLKWKQDRDKGIMKKFLALFEIDSIDTLKKELRNILEEDGLLTKQFNSSLESLKKQDYHFENKDDEVRVKLADYLEEASDRLGENSNEIEKRLLLKGVL